MIGQEKNHTPLSNYYKEFTVGSGYAIMKQHGSHHIHALCA